MTSTAKIREGQLRDELRATKRKLKQTEDRADRLEAAIRKHHTLVTKKDDWSQDMVLWKTLGLRP